MFFFVRTFAGIRTNRSYGHVGAYHKDRAKYDPYLIEVLERKPREDSRGKWHQIPPRSRATWILSLAPPYTIASPPRSGALRVPPLPDRYLDQPSKPLYVI